VLRRRPEAYHEALREMEAAMERGENAAGISGVSIHDQLMAKESGLSAALVYDDHERRSGLVRVLDGGDNDVGDFVNGHWETAEVSDSVLVATRLSDGLHATKSITLGGGRQDPSLSIELEVEAEHGFDGFVELEMNLNLSGGGANPDAYYRWADQDQRHDSAGRATADGLTFGNERQAVNVALSTTPPGFASWSPVETVSNSEAGFEKVYQGSCLLVRWPLALRPGESAAFSARYEVGQTIDNAVTELS